MGLFSAVKEKVSQYIDVHVQLIKLKLIGHASRMLGSFIFSIMVLFIMFCIILFLGFGLSELFVESGLSRLASLFLVTGIYVLFLAIVMALRRPIIRFFTDSAVSMITDDVDDKNVAE